MRRLLVLEEDEYCLGFVLDEVHVVLLVGLKLSVQAHMPAALLEAQVQTAGVQMAHDTDTATLIGRLLHVVLVDCCRI